MEWSRDFKRTRKKKHHNWRSQAQQQIYSSNLRQALASAPRRGKAVRESADRVLAITGKGRSRWSRAILAKRVKLKLRKRKRRWKKGKGVERRVRFLGGLIPGCRKEGLTVILEEAIDYIPALEMQVRAMTALFNLLSSASASASTST
ncbi:hypothetical protein RJT34_32339 [Clitoria ternatea]|uniref:Transcription factor n=1 Tax=Clitoria ternatea TaxID=43366 RepID=A0AAN9I4G4_CLITE